MRLGVAGGRLFRVMKFKAFSALLLFSFLCGRPLRAEVIRGPAELRSADTGKAAASLYDGAKVECVRSTAPWIETGFLAYVEPAYLEEGGGLRKGAVFYDKTGRTFGRVTETFSLDFSPGKPDAKTGRVELEIVLLANYRDIKQDSILEIALASELKGARSAPAPAALAGHLKKFGYEKWSGCEGVESYGVYENWIEDPSPGFRALLIFQAGKLAAVLHSREINYKFVSTKEFSRGSKLSYVRKLPEAGMKKLEKFYSDILSSAD